jgi:hypothetical protein
MWFCYIFSTVLDQLRLKLTLAESKIFWQVFIQNLSTHYFFQLFEMFYHEISKIFINADDFYVLQIWM